MLYIEEGEQVLCHLHRALGAYLAWLGRGTPKATALSRINPPLMTRAESRTWRGLLVNAALCRLP